MTEKGKRASIWFPQEDVWLLKAVDRRVRIAAAAGIEMSRNDELRAILRRELQHDGEVCNDPTTED
jgi:hypothetical protein